MQLEVIFVFCQVIQFLHYLYFNFAVPAPHTDNIICQVVNDNGWSPPFNFRDYILKEDFAVQAYECYDIVAASVVEVLLPVHLCAVAAGCAGEGSFFYCERMIHLKDFFVSERKIIRT